MEKVAYAIAESVPIIRWALSRIVEEQPNSTVDKEVDSAHRLIEHFQKHSTEVTIVRLNEYMALAREAQQQIKSHTKLIIAITDNDEQPNHSPFFETVSLLDGVMNIQKAIRKATCEMSKHKESKREGNALSDREIEM